MICCYYCNQPHEEKGGVCTNCLEKIAEKKKKRIAEMSENKRWYHKINQKGD